MPRYLPVAAAVILLCSACNEHRAVGSGAAADVGNSYLAVARDSVTMPSFSIELKLNAEAEGKLLHDKESVIIAAWFAGIPKDTLSKEYKESGEMLISAYSKEVMTERMVKFENIKFSRSRYDSLAGNDIYVRVHVVSGRRSTPDNLLDCELFSGRMSRVMNKKITLAGKLTGATDSLQIHGD